MGGRTKSFDFSLKTMVHLICSANIEFSVAPKLGSVVFFIPAAFPDCEIKFISPYKFKNISHKEFLVVCRSRAKEKTFHIQRTTTKKLLWLVSSNECFADISAIAFLFAYLQFIVQNNTNNFQTKVCYILHCEGWLWESDRNCWQNTGVFVFIIKKNSSISKMFTDANNHFLDACTRFCNVFSALQLNAFGFGLLVVTVQIL